MPTTNRRAALLAMLVVPPWLLSDSVAAWERILMGPFESIWFAVMVIVVAWFAYGLATSSRLVTAKGLMTGLAVMLFVSFTTYYGVDWSTDEEGYTYDPPPPVPTALSNHDRAGRNYLWYSSAICAGAFIAARRGRARMSL